MKAVIKTGGKQYTVKVGDKLDIEKIEGSPKDKITLDAICIIDGSKVEADPKKASKTPVKAEIIEQHKGEKVVVFKFKRRKNYKVKRGHRQNLTSIKITAIGSETIASKKTAASKPKKQADSKKTSTKQEKKSTTKKAEKPATKAATKSTSNKTATTKSTKPAEKKEQPKKPVEKEAPKTTKKAESKTDSKGTASKSTGNKQTTSKTEKK